MKVDPRIVNEATAFFNLGKQEYLKQGNSINTEEDAYTFIPIIVNLAFSIELFLKSMLDSPWGHDLEKLFMQIDDNEKKSYPSTDYKASATIRT